MVSDKGICDFTRLLNLRESKFQVFSSIRNRLSNARQLEVLTCHFMPCTNKPVDRTAGSGVELRRDRFAGIFPRSRPNTDTYIDQEAASGALS